MPTSKKTKSKTRDIFGKKVASHILASNASPIKIISDGTVLGTQVIYAKTGERIPLVKSIKLEIDAESETATCELVLYGVPIVATVAKAKKNFISVTKG